MSEVYVHGVVAAGEPAAEGEAARRVAHRDLAALVTDVAEPRATDALRKHWRVLEAAGATATVLPVRFGTAMADEQAVVDAFLAPRYDGLTSALAQLAGKVQLAVKAFYDEESLMRSVVAASPPIAKLQARVKAMPEAASYYERIRLGELVAAEVARVRERDTARVLDALAPLAVETIQEAPSSVETAVNLAFLVERARVDEFSQVVTRLGEELAGHMRLRYVGPLPPYSFTTEEAGTWA